MPQSRFLHPPLLIAGMHRSGTSLTAHFLERCGLDLGPADELAPAKPDNLDGFWENVRLVAINDDLLASVGGAWDRPPTVSVLRGEGVDRATGEARLVFNGFDPNRPWGWKDARNSLTLDYWLTQFEDLGVVICLRNPLEVARSLQTRNYLSIETGLTLWHEYTRAISAIPANRRIVVHFESLVMQDGAEIRRLCRFANLPEPDDDMLRRVLPTARADLRHHGFRAIDLLTFNVSGPMVRLYRDLCAEAGRADLVEPLLTFDGREPSLALFDRRSFEEMLRRQESEWRRSQVVTRKEPIDQRKTALRQVREELRQAESNTPESEPRVGMNLTDRVLGTFAAELDATRTERSRLTRQLLGLQRRLAKSDRKIAYQQGVTAERLAHQREEMEQLFLQQQHERTRDYEQKLLDRSYEHERQLQDRERQYDGELQSVRNTLEGELSVLRTEAVRLRRDLDAVHGSRLWKTAQLYWGVLARLGRLEPKMSPVLAPPLPSPNLLPSPVADTEAVAGPRAMTLETSSVPVAVETNPCIADLRSIMASFRARFDRAPSLLDWASGIEIAKLVPDEMVFSPVSSESPLPYLDGSVDLVFIARNDSHKRQEAGRVARTAVMQVSQVGTATIFDTSWLEDDTETPRQRVTIIIPVFNQSSFTRDCLQSLLDHPEKDMDVEIVVVDDASTDDTTALLLEFAARSPMIRSLRNEANSGFIDSCNRGAAAARHEMLVFLNNDTIPAPGWLSALVGTFSTHPQAGAAGAKLVYPDGRLQEAGGAIFSDGDGANIGRLLDPTAPLFNYVREVDYCSGAALATPRALFEKLGGFDVRYRPAYYEDADYCFAVRAAGRKVYFQPASVVVHKEGVSSGTDLSRGVKRYQVENRKKFKKKWRDALAAQPEHPDTMDYAAFHRLCSRGKGRALVVSHTVPEYDREGGSRRLFHLIEFLRDEGWDVSFMAPQVPWGERYERELQQSGVAVYRHGNKVLDNDRYATEAHRLIATGNFELAIIAFWHIAEEWMPVIRKLSPSTQVMIDSIDLHFLRLAREVLSMGGTLDASYADQMRRELNVYASSDLVLTVSGKESDVINDFAGRPRLAVPVPESEATDHSEHDFEDRSGILFVGSFRHPPNVGAAEHLLTNILPLIDEELLARHPVYIVGTDLPERIRKLGRGRPYVRMAGWVPSVFPYLHSARVAVVPLLNGAGTKTKLIQALITGIPSVATTVGAEGLPVEDEAHFLLANDPREFADDITRLLTDEALWNRISRDGRAMLETTHGRTAGKARFADSLRLLKLG